MLKDPEMISVETASVAGTVSFDETIATTTSTAPDQLIQNVVVVPPKLRLVTLDALLLKISKHSAERTIVFSRVQIQLISILMYSLETVKV